jgi:hypothetical protein
MVLNKNIFFYIYNYYRYKILKQSINGFCVSIKTDIGKYLLKNNNFSKNEEYICIQNTPCKIIKLQNNMIYMNCFASKRIFCINIYKFYKQFKLIELKDNFIELESYPVKIHETEFEKRFELYNIEENLKKILKNNEISDKTKLIFKDKLIQVFYSQGADYITINDIKEYNNGKIKLSKHKKFGCMYFNRNFRWAPPIDITYDEFKKTKSYPAPIGIRNKDFALPSELIETFKKLVNNIVNMNNFPQNEFYILKNNFKFIYLHEYACEYCCKKLNYDEYTSEYKSAHNFMEICHKNPNDNFNKNNIYFGHGECNRRQGGYTEQERIIDGLNLLLNKNLIDKSFYNNILVKLM